MRLELGGKSLVVFHGHEPEFQRLVELAEAGEYERLAESAAADYVLFGHAHVPFDERFGRVRIVSPGAVQRARQRSVATLDLSRDELRFWEVDGEGGSLRGLTGLRWAAGD